MQFFLSVSDLDFLIKHIQLGELIESFEKAKSKGEHLAKGQYATRKYSLELSEKQIDQILEGLSLLFATEGTENNGEPNTLGLYIENLIDLFHTEN